MNTKIAINNKEDITMEKIKELSKVLDRFIDLQETFLENNGYTSERLDISIKEIVNLIFQLQ